MVTVVEPECFACRHLEEWPTCKAYPNGIPQEIREGEPHRKPREDDRGFQFDPVQEQSLET